MKGSISKFETVVQQLIEGSFSRLLGGRLMPTEIANRLADAMEDSRRDGLAADLYEVRLSPGDFADLQSEVEDLGRQLARYLEQLARQAGFVLAATPVIELVSDPAVRRRRVVVKAAYTQAAQEPTRRRTREEVQAVTGLAAVDAYLIIDGKQHIRLDRSLMSLGRQLDNDIVIDDATVSRYHAQLRWRYGRFVLYDLDSRGGTLVNDQPVKESALQNGDIITLSRVPLIYGEGWAEGSDSRPHSTASGQSTLGLPRSELSDSEI